MDRMFRVLRADEIECRVSTINNNGLSLLLYKDARVDQNLLDEVVGPMNWQRRHELINGSLFCSVGILNSSSGEWVWKQDVGTESKTEAEKGQASDAFKRACFNWGIGRELYTAPFIWITAKQCEIKEKSGRNTTYDKFDVTRIEYDGGVISYLEITNTKRNTVVFTYGKPREGEAAEVREQIRPVTNETVKAATQEPLDGGKDPDAQIDDIEQASIEALAKKAWPSKAIEEIFPKWPSMTNAEYCKAAQIIKEKLGQ